MKRVKARRKCANPLFEKWLMEWQNEAREKGSSVERHFAKAIISLQKYPLRLESGRDCILLQHFGTKLCQMLDRKLKSHEDCRRDAHDSDTERVDTCDDVEHDILPKKSKSLEGAPMTAELESRKKSYEKTKKNVASPIPRRRRVHSISSSDSNDRDSPIVEISNIDDDWTNGPVDDRENFKERRETVKNLKTKLPVQESKSRNNESPRNGADNLATPIGDEFHLVSNNFDVLLLVDTHETGSGKTKSKEDATKLELDRLSVAYEIRHLKIGDFAWIARCRDTNRELILPYIVERKRMDDLASSIKDGRFHEQKFRLKQSGIPNLIYMVESYGNNQHIGIPLPTLLQAATNSLVQDDFTVKFTKTHSHSMQYLSILTTLIRKIYKEKHLVSSTKENLEAACALNDAVPLMEFNQFNKAASKAKTFKVKEMFVRHLLQLKGLSLEKALAIVELYPTPIILTRAYQSAGKEAEKLLSTIKVGPTKRQLGPAMSKTIYELYTKGRLE